MIYLEKFFVPLELKSELDELGMKYEGLEYYKTPLYSQAFAFFRQKYGLYGMVIHAYGLSTFEIEDKDKNYKLSHDHRFNDEGSDVELICLKHLIEIAKNK